MCLTGTPARAADAPASLRVVHTDHYTVYTDIADAALVADTGRRMDVMYGLYAQQLSDFRPAPDAPPLPAYLFNSKGRYLSKVGPAGINSAGVFVYLPQQYLASYLGEQGRDGFRQALQHEGFHQFAYFTVSRHLPPWFNEGLAQVFEQAIWTGQTYLVGQVPPGAIHQLRYDLDHGRMMPLARFVTVTPQAWNDVLRRDPARSETYYNQAWAVAQFLTHGPSPDYRARGLEFLRRLHALDRPAATPDPALDAEAVPRAFAACFPDPAALQTAFDAWARTLRATDGAVMLNNQAVLADFLIALHAGGRTFASIPAFRAELAALRLHLTYPRRAYTYRTAPDPRVYFADLNGAVYGPDQLLFVPFRGAPLPDILCRPAPGYNIRTHFYIGPTGRVEREVAVEPTAAWTGPTR